MKKYKFGFKAFTLTEMLIVAAIALVVIASIPIIMLSRRNDLSGNSAHGEIECKYNNGVDGAATCIDNTKPAGQNEIICANGNCDLSVPGNVKKFIVQVIPATGAGSTAHIDNLGQQTNESFELPEAIFNPRFVDEINHDYTVRYPTHEDIINTLRDRNVANVVSEEVIDQLIIPRTVNELNNTDIEVILRAPNGVKPVMQYYRPNLDYVSFRGLYLFGNATLPSNYIFNTSFKPWPNMLRYSEIALLYKAISLYLKIFGIVKLLYTIMQHTKLQVLILIFPEVFFQRLKKCL